MKVFPIALGGGVDGRSPLSLMNPGRLRIGINVESKRGGGYRRVEGYTKFDANEVPGEGDILGVWHYNNKVYAFRNAVGGATAVMHESTGSGWTSKKTGLAPDGRYEFVNYAFSGTQKMYGCDGKNKAFQWDGSTYTELTTLMATDTPKHITAHKNHLFLSFDNSVQNSGLGDPTSWSVLTGTTEILQPDTVTGLIPLPNGTLGIFTETGISYLSGSSVADFVATNMIDYGSNAGALPYTIQRVGSRVLFTDSRGVTDLVASDTSSDFYDAIISHDMDKTLEGLWNRAIASTFVRSKDQYRLFFNDGTGLILTMDQNAVMITQINWPDVVRCVVNSEDSSGDEVIYFGSDDGYIYQMENGRSFGGDDITATMETAFTDVKMPSQVKRWRRMRVVTGKTGNSSLTVTPTFAIGTYAKNATPVGVTLPAALGILGESILGSAILGGAPLDDGRAALNGRSEFVAIRFQSVSDDEPAWELDELTIEYLVGRQRK